MYRSTATPIKQFLIVFLFSFVCLAGMSCGKSEKNNPGITAPAEVNTFSNPIINGADPSVYQKDGFYYYLQTVGNSIRLWKTKAMSSLSSVIPTTVYTPVAGTPNSRNIWAPEIYFMDGKWYIYYTAGDGSDISQRTWVLENSNADPTVGTWVEKGKIFNSAADNWAIDGSILNLSNQWYFLWCGRPDPTNIDLKQVIYISKMANPWTLDGAATIITEPDLNWEKNGFAVNEAPQILKNSANRVFLFYSASYCGTDDYSLGMLTLTENGNPLIKTNWTKTPNPVFVKKPQSNAYGPGHNSFFTSADGKQNWIIYHANSASNQGCADQRNVRMQPFTFNADGTPNLGEPVATGLKIEKPSGE